MRKKALLFALVLGLCTTLLGCAGGNGTGKTSSGQNNSIVVGIQNDLDSLDPHLAETAGTREVMYNVFEGLVKPSANGDLVPAVASDYKVSEDGKVYTFTLRENVKFHNGEAVTAEDVKYSIERNAGKLDEDLLVSAFKIIESVNIVDPSTVEVVLSEADTELIGYMTVAILPKDYANQKTAPVGTGPFKFVSYTPQQNLKLEKFEDYWQENSPSLDAVEFRIVQNTDSVIMDLKAGSIDVYPYLTDAQAAELSGSFNIEAGNSNLTQAMYLNHDHEILGNKLVRQALCYAIDRDEIMSIVAGGKGTKLGSALYPGFGKYYNDLSDKYSYDIEKAKALLKEAGYENGFEFTIRIPSNYQFHVSTGEVIVEQLKKINVTAKIELIDWTSWVSDVYGGRQFEATIVGIDAKLAPSDMLRRYELDYSKNFYNYKSESYTAAFQAGLATTDDAEKVSNYQTAQEILAEDAVAVYIMDPPTLVAVDKDLTGFTFYPIFVLDMASISYK
jgi:peptide/nickel transport system substrate-binding protein